MTKKTKNNFSYQVLRDTREQQGWDFPAQGPCLGTLEQALPTGDYTLAGFEDLFVIERKATTGELAGNLVEARFTRELERLAELAWPFLVCEFTWADLLRYPAGSGIPPAQWSKLRLRPGFLLKALNELPLRYGVHVVLVGDEARTWCTSMFKRVIERQRPPAKAGGLRVATEVPPH